MCEDKSPSQEMRKLETGSLWQKVKECTKKAIECGALHSIVTECEFIEEVGIRFVVRVASNLVRKDEFKKKVSKPKDFNPFLPYEEDLFVADLSETHLCLLNKFNVVDYHLLIVTRVFEEQETWLNLADFEAMELVLNEFDGLVFYNSGRLAGASQRHKHLQVVPMMEIPIKPVLEGVCFDDNGVGRVPGFDFVHAFSRLEKGAKSLLEVYHCLLRAVGFEGDFVGDATGAYNLFATRDWMFVVRRSCEDFEGISVNGLGFVGTFFVRNEGQLDRLKNSGPVMVLKQVALS
ncbi:phosphorylase [Ancylothrix sp. C2]|uniref:ATP adenylyltransferase family protein n=1 Tax=Ancylothrix sp. D3o TaxID=2953691 RepID=UPI0021BA7BAC|nr:phosphorylase [Ancylothrix sp. D3o]MCT7950421.1 phosphorylase [Ancylothrix sp. D3o]